MAKTEISELLEAADQGIDDFFESENYKSYLDFISIFHSYSINNIMLIKQQYPSATQVAGYKKWQTLDRHVKRGEDGIAIIRPYNRYYDKKNIDEKGNEVIEKIPVIKYTRAYVFDVSQTDGRELPEPLSALSGNVIDFEKKYNAVRALTDYKVSFIGADLLGASYGACSYSDGQIYIKEGLSEAQTLKTLVHEVFHSNNHSNSDKSREYKEMEAEAAAYVVCNALGLDTSDYSFGYIAIWSKSSTHEERVACIKGIKDTADRMLTAIEDTLNERSINNTSVSEYKEMSEVNAAETLGVSEDRVKAYVYDVSPAEREENIIRVKSAALDYDASFKIKGLTESDITKLLSSKTEFDYLDQYITSNGGTCKINSISVGDSYNYLFDLDKNELIAVVDDTERAASVILSYDSSITESEAFKRMQTISTLSGTEISIIPVQDAPYKELYSGQTSEYEKMNVPDIWPMVTIKYANIDNRIVPSNMNIQEAASLIKSLPEGYIRIKITYCYNDVIKEHNEIVKTGKDIVNFVDYLDIPVPEATHLKNHMALIDMTDEIEQMAFKSTYGRRYADRVQEWAQYCRMKINHESDEPVIPQLPLMDEKYNIKYPQEFKLER